MKGTHLLEEQDSGLAADNSRRRAQTRPRLPRGIETENENYVHVKRSTLEHCQSILAVVNRLDLVITAVLDVPEEFTRYEVAVDEQDSPRHDPEYVQVAEATQAPRRRGAGDFRNP